MEENQENQPLLSQQEGDLNITVKDDIPSPPQLDPTNDPLVVDSLHFRFLNDDGIDPELICSICQQPFNDPSRSVNCGHSFCRSCIDHWATVKRTCPLDNIQLNQMQFDRLAFNLVDKLQVQCLLCDWQGTRADIRLHQKETHQLAQSTTPSGNYGYVATYRAPLPIAANRQPVTIQRNDQNGDFQNRCEFHPHLESVARCEACSKGICADCSRIQNKLCDRAAIVCVVCYGDQSRVRILLWFFCFLFSVVCFIAYWAITCLVKP
eukprot:TRINITY_DN7797_c0_g1_i1.p1 TRINITY_DN7797_c0_g1~~TRINITY_DN7797_c0_g1_i1.p1  ORF type:complete len:265 (-),score=19.20 TRINITY_DN7797_c0_g1_i1:120-914(-)